MCMCGTLLRCREALRVDSLGSFTFMWEETVSGSFHPAMSISNSLSTQATKTKNVGTVTRLLDAPTRTLLGRNPPLHFPSSI